MRIRNRPAADPTQPGPAQTRPTPPAACSRRPSPRRRSRASGLAVAVVTLLSLALSTGCFPGPTGWLDDYLTRLERVTGQPNPASDLRPDPLRYPDRRTRVADLDALSANRMGLVRSRTLRRCGLQDLVGDRNSALGKVMQPSRRLAYEVEFIRRVNACLPTLEGDADLATLATELQTARDAKMEALPALIWNATLGSDEVAQGFAVGEGRWKRTRPRVQEAREEMATWRDAFDEMMRVPELVTRAISSAGLPSQGPGSDVRDQVAAAVEGPAQALSNGAAGRLLATVTAAETAMRASSAMLDAVQCAPGTSAARERPASPVAAAMAAAQVAEATWRKPKDAPAASTPEEQGTDAASRADSPGDEGALRSEQTGDGPDSNGPDTSGPANGADPSGDNTSGDADSSNSSRDAETTDPSPSDGSAVPRLDRDQADILLRVFEIFYVGEDVDRLQRVGLQEFASQLEQEVRPLVDAFGGALRTLERGAPAAFLESDFALRLLGAQRAPESATEGTPDGSAADALDARFRRATADHAAAWQRVFTACELSPTGPFAPPASGPDVARSR